MQFQCNTSAKSVIHCKLHIVILDYDWKKVNQKFCRPNIISCKAMTKILYRDSEKKSFLDCVKWLQETSAGTFSARIFSRLNY